MQINDLAAVKLKELIAETENPEGQMLRIHFAGYG